MQEFVKKYHDHYQRQLIYAIFETAVCYFSSRSLVP